MNRMQTFQQFLATQSVHIPVLDFLLNLLIAAALAFILGQLYVAYGTSLSNRRMFARNFVLITATTMLVISIVKSSLALSLGLVGALSIVRFRTAIKEPEELAYMFLAIGIGLGLGADQRLITIAAFALIVGILALRHRLLRREEGEHNLYVTVTSDSPQRVALQQVVETLKRYCSAVSLKRVDESAEHLEAAFLVEFENFDQLKESSTALRQLNDRLKITFLDNRGIA